VRVASEVHSRRETFDPADDGEPESVTLDRGDEPAEADPRPSEDSHLSDDATPDGDLSAPVGHRRLPVLLGVAAAALAIDVVSKLLVVAKLSNHEPVRVPGGFLRLTLIRNSGAAFSIGESQTWVFTIIAVAVAVVILRVSRNLRSLSWACALGLLLGGALGNLGDRFFRSPGFFRGHVVDFLQFPTFPVINWDFPVFNLADSAIVLGGCLMVLLSFLGVQPDGTRHAKPAKPEKSPES
jgi:signal peptidase II